MMEQKERTVLCIDIINCSEILQQTLFIMHRTPPDSPAAKPLSSLTMRYLLHGITITGESEVES